MSIDLEGQGDVRTYPMGQLKQGNQDIRRGRGNPAFLEAGLGRVVAKKEPEIDMEVILIFAVCLLYKISKALV